MAIDLKYQGFEAILLFISLFVGELEETHILFLVSPLSTVLYVPFLEIECQSLKHFSDVVASDECYILMLEHRY
ncbi:hypothetical protein GDO81_028897 [Engystomops pustulosus]|uniref:Uncharacterized protein n=1 Tax=Engystomops pustulosus TaxID=76066 RepID=A0AAV6ZLX8_ENGPU|nr:hypothetical protein GDO81_028897 [Engystomops pustulosus]